MSSKRDYYETLGVGRSASKEEIRKAYRRLAREYHPDVNKAPDAEARFKEINEAYQVLSDDEKRTTYDRFGRVDLPGGFGTDFTGFGGLADIFEDFFGGFGVRTRRGRRSPTRGTDLRYNLTISFEEAVFGCEKEIEVSRSETCPACQGSGAEPGTSPMRCPQCNGSGEVRRVQQSIFGSFVNVSTCGRCQGTGEVITTPCRECRGNKQVERTRRIAVEIPAGVEEGISIRLTGEGENGTHGGPSGDLFVSLSVKEHPFFRRVDSDILLEVPINIVQAALGDDIEVPTLEGKEQLHIPPGTQTGRVFRLPGKGAPYLRRNGRGDQVVTVRLVTPTHLNEEQKALLRELAKTLDDEGGPSNYKNFFDRMRDAIGR